MTHEAASPMQIIQVPSGPAGLVGWDSDDHVWREIGDGGETAGEKWLQLPLRDPSAFPVDGATLAVVPGSIVWGDYTTNYFGVAAISAESTGTENKNRLVFDTSASEGDAFVFRSGQEYAPQPTMAAIAADGTFRTAGPLQLGNPDTSARLYSGVGAPNSYEGAQGNFYFRTDTPSTANQRLYVKTSATVWTPIL